MPGERNARIAPSAGPQSGQLCAVADNDALAAWDICLADRLNNGCEALFLDDTAVAYEA